MATSSSAPSFQKGRGKGGFRPRNTEIENPEFEGEENPEDGDEDLDVIPKGGDHGDASTQANPARAWQKRNAQAIVPLVASRVTGQGVMSARPRAPSTRTPTRARTRARARTMARAPLPRRCSRSVMAVVLILWWNTYARMRLFQIKQKSHFAMVVHMAGSFECTQAVHEAVGFMILDTACQRSCCGTAWIRAHTEKLNELGLKT